MEAREKPLVWLKGEVKTPPFSARTRLEAGVLLRRLQRGERLCLPVSRPMSSIGTGCHELRIVDENVTWRIIYALDADAVVVLEVFAKKSRATPNEVVTNCKRRLGMYRASRETGSSERRRSD
jgi:phage-related protein